MDDDDRIPDSAILEMYAGMAMAGFCACSDFQSPTPENIAKAAFDQAEAMMVERAKRRTK